ncbi:MAG: hypothetical protein AB7P69_24475 [Candidatus Binatia bacterium]
MTSYGGNQRGPLSVLTFFFLAVFMLGMNFPTRANADDCVALGGVLNAGECQISGNQIKSNANCVGGLSCQLDETLHFLNSSSLTVSPQTAGLTLNITGDLIMEPGSKINGNGGPGTTANITVNATGNITLKQGALGVPGAMITANRSGGCSTQTNNFAGTIMLNADVDGNFAGDVDIQGSSSANPDDRAKVQANSDCSAGAIFITGTKITIDGLVESVGGASGLTVSFQPPGGGPITVDAACELLVSDSGKISSRGRDPGADLVHLEGGCSVEINGLVESFGIGHATPTTPHNHCNFTNRPDKPTDSTSCVEVWAGNQLIINSLPPHNGQVSADNGGPGGTSGTGWLDLFARGDITITGRTLATDPFAVHANGLSGTNDQGGVVTIKSRDGQVIASGRAVQASAVITNVNTGLQTVTPGGKGGTVVIQAKLDVDLQGGTVEAKGATFGGAPAGGVIMVRSFGTAPSTGSILGSASSVLDVTGGALPAQLGSIGLTACGTIAFPPGTTLPAAVTPTKVTGTCGGAPTFSVYVVLPDCPPECFLSALCACINDIEVNVQTSTLTILGSNFIGPQPLNPNIQLVGFAATCDPNTACTVVVNPASDSTITVALPACAQSGDRVIIGINGNPSFSCSAELLP